MKWLVPAHVTGPVEQIKDRKLVTLFDGRLGLRERKVIER